MLRALLTLLVVVALSACGALGGKGAGKTNPVVAVFKDPLTNRQLKPALLTEGDVPVRYNVETKEDETDEAEKGKVAGSRPECKHLWNAIGADRGPKPVGKAKVAFTAGEYGPFLSEWISSYRGEKVKNDLAILEVALKKCPSFKTTGDDLAYKSAPMTFPDLGDQTVAGKLSVTEPTLGITFELEFVEVRVDQNKIALLNLGFGKTGLKPKEFEKVVRTAVQRVQAAS